MKKMILAIMAIAAIAFVGCRPDYVSYHNLTLGKYMDEVHKSLTSAGYEITLESPNGKLVFYDNGKFSAFETESMVIGMDDHNKLEMVSFMIINEIAYVSFDSSIELLNSPHAPIYGEPTDISITDDRHKSALWDFEDKHIQLNLNSDTLTYFATAAPSTVKIMRRSQN
jgi:hypothetical protein